MAYTKQTVQAGDVMDPAWGNHIQTQYDEAAKEIAPTIKGDGETVQSGSESISISSSTTGYIDVTFPIPFTESPKIIVSTQSTNYHVSFSSRSTTGVRITVRHLDGTSVSSATVYVDWLAIGK